MDSKKRPLPKKNKWPPHLQKKNLAQVSKKCEQCFKIGYGFKTCSQCLIAYYCSSGCQKHHWKAHKHICVQLVTANNKWQKQNDGIDISTTLNLMRRAVRGSLDMLLAQRAGRVGVFVTPISLLEEKECANILPFIFYTIGQLKIKQKMNESWQKPLLEIARVGPETNFIMYGLTNQDDFLITTTISIVPRVEK